MGKLIDLDTAIDAVVKESQVDGAYGYMDTKSIVDLLNNLLSTQPEIVRCKDCKHLFNKDDLGGKCWHFNGFSKVVSYDDFCSRAERRTDE